MSVAERPTAERLLDGAKQIGAYYRAGDRCATMGWAVKGLEGAESCEAQLDADELCKCGKKSTRFCKAKVKWLIVAMMEPREIQMGEYGLALTMSGAEWDATGLSLIWEPPEIGTTKVGPKSGISMKMLRELGIEPMSGITTLKLMRAFPGAKMEFEKSELKADPKETEKAASE